MSNEEYQAVIRLPGDQIRRHLLRGNAGKYPQLAAVIQNVSDETLPSVLSNLGGHDMEELLSVFAQVDEEPNQPSIIFAYTIKGWGLPIAGHPLNHSMLLNEKQIADLRNASDVPLMMIGRGLILILPRSTL